MNKPSPSPTEQIIEHIEEKYKKMLTIRESRKDETFDYFIEGWFKCKDEIITYLKSLK
jgi:hypothetical protein